MRQIILAAEATANLGGGVCLVGNKRFKFYQARRTTSTEASKFEIQNARHVLSHFMTEYQYGDQITLCIDAHAMSSAMSNHLRHKIIQKAALYHFTMCVHVQTFFLRYKIIDIQHQIGCVIKIKVSSKLEKNFCGVCLRTANHLAKENTEGAEKEMAGINAEVYY